MQILHDMNHVVSDNQSAIWMVLSDDDAKLAQKQEDDKYMSHQSDSTDFVCVRCGERVSFLSALKSHTRFRLVIRNFLLALLRHRCVLFLGTARKISRKTTIG
jgi:hypothetical protein